jgi:hypothetical protein
MSHISAALNSRKLMDVIYLDIKKAFDTVPHRRLLLKLFAPGVEGPALKWFENYLKGRVQAVRIRDSISSDKAILSGVPQGSILGPLLFQAYIADLPSIVESPSKIRLFADDSKLYREISCADDENKLQLDLNKVEKWCESWLLKLNLDKCKHIRFGRSPLSHEYDLQNSKISSVLEEKDLGVTFDRNLTFQTHINTKIKVANRNLAIIRNSFRFIGQDAFVLLYKSLVRPHLEYCSPVWNTSLKTISQKIEKVQRRASKFCWNLRSLSYNDRLVELGLPSLEFRRFREDVIAAFKICKFHPDLKHFFKFQQRDGLRGHEFCFQKERSTNKATRNFLPNRIFSTWNGLPDHFSSLPTLNALKSFIDARFRGACHTCRRPLSLQGVGELVVGRTELEVAGCPTRVPAHPRA